MLKKIKLYALLALILSFAVGFGILLSDNKVTPIQAQIEEVENEDIVIPESYCMRDDYYILTTNQFNQGLCWAFAGSSVFSTAVMKSTNQYIDYSEAWISEEFSYHSSTFDPGGGGTFGGFKSVIMEGDGIVQEQDFNFEDTYKMSKENVADLHEYYAQYADTTIVKNYSTVLYNYLSAENETERQELINNVKRHLLTQSALHINMAFRSASGTYNGHTIYFYDSQGTYHGSHALTVIGWDDNIEVTYNGNYHKGAWIFLNSWGNSYANQGIYYLFYDSTSVASYFLGFRYNKEYDDLYFFNELTESSANFKNQFKGAYTDTLEKSVGDTKQKNIFTDTNNVNMTYSYEISPDTTLDEIKIFNFQEDVTDKFNIVNDTTNNKITITAKSQLKLSTYKILFTYSNGENSETISGAFYVVNGSETEYIGVSILNSTPNTNVNLAYQAVSPLNNGQKTLVASAINDTGTLQLRINMAMYCFITQAKILNGSTGEILYESIVYQNPARAVPINFSYNLQQTNHLKLQLIGLNGDNIFEVYIFKIDPEQEVCAIITYDVAGGINNLENYKANVISKSQPTLIKNPTKKGYNFVGWYYSSNFNENSKLQKINQEYYLEFSKISHYDTYSVFWLANNDDTASNNFYNFVLFAKWEKIEDEETYYTLTINVNGNGYVSDVGIIYVKENSNKKITICELGYIVAQIVIDDNLVDASNYSELIQNGIEFNDITQDHSLVVTFVSSGAIKYYVYHWLQAKSSTIFTHESSYYDMPIIETYYGYENELTSAVAKNYQHFSAKSFEQQTLTSSSANTIINIYYQRNKYTISITFTGIDSNDINESVMYEITRTYNLCPDGYRILSCKVDNVDYVGSSVTFENIDANHNVQVELQLITYNVTISTNNGGEVTCNKQLNNILPGENREFTVTPDNGYFVEQVKVNGEIIELNNNKFSLSVDNYIQIEVTFGHENEEIIEPDNKETIEYENDNNFLIIIGIAVVCLTIIIVPIVTIIVKSKNRYY